MMSSTFEQAWPKYELVLSETDRESFSQDLTAQARRPAGVFRMLVRGRERDIAQQSTLLEQTSTARPLAPAMFSQISALGQTKATQSQPSEMVTFAAEILRHLVTNQMLDAARAFLARRAPSDISELSAWRRVLAEPRAQPRCHTGADRSRDYEWITHHSRDYLGQWVALVEGELVGHGPRLNIVLRDLDSQALRTRALIHKIR